MDCNDQTLRASRLVSRIVQETKYGILGSGTIAIYDTAWLSMVTKLIDGQTQWAFPESFEYILQHQSPDGGWQDDASSDNAILNGLAGLLALQKHHDTPNLNDETPAWKIKNRISMTENYVRCKMRQWDVKSSLLVGFEILVPTLLDLLERCMPPFDFPDRQALQTLREMKLKDFDPRTLYSTPTTMLHSLEAFIGLINFDNVKNLKAQGSMMCSPSSTAAYLMYASDWDDEAENYIRRVIAQGVGHGNGGVPSAFPTPIFETTWVVSTLLHNGFRREFFNSTDLEFIAMNLLETFEAQNGSVGFAPLVVPDADDTAKTILTLSLLGKSVPVQAMINTFKVKQGHFRTYLMERDASFSANCNAIQAMLRASDMNKHSQAISETAAFLCEAWFLGAMKDKWNSSLHYTQMLLAQAFVSLLSLWDQRLLDYMPQDLVRDRIPMVLTQILNRILLSQEPAGCWESENSLEHTAYTILTLKTVQYLPWLAPLRSATTLAVQRGTEFLIRSERFWTNPQLLWIEKVSYGMASLSEAHCLAAIHSTSCPQLWSNRLCDLIQVPEKAFTQLTCFFSALEMFRDESQWKLQASLLEGLLYLPQLESTKLDVLPRQRDAKNEYLKSIPCTWTMINNHFRIFLPPSLIWDMIVLTLCNFRADEYMETLTAHYEVTGFQQIKKQIESLFTIEGSSNSVANGRPPEDAFIHTNHSDGTGDHNVVQPPRNNDQTDKVLRDYTITMLQHPRIGQASPPDRASLQIELQTFLHSHVNQAIDNHDFSLQRGPSPVVHQVFRPLQTSFYSWAHGTGADSVSCPMSFAFFTCLLGSMYPTTTDCFISAYHKYLARDLCSRLAVMSRLYNDYGSLARDRAEGNINSINFPEFDSGEEIQASDSSDETQARLKQELLTLAEYERENADYVLEKLRASLKAGNGIDQAKAKALQLFAKVATLYADMYVAKDLSNRKDGTSGT